MAISSVGIGSGVLTSDLIDKLAEVERGPTELRLNAKEEVINAKISAFGQLQSAVTDLRLPARLLSNPKAMQEQTFSSSNSAVSGFLGPGAKSGTYSLEVSSLASAQSLSTAALADTNVTGLGTGVLTLSVGGKSTDITIDSTNNTLDGIADAINAESSLDATATVIDNGSGYQLVISANQTGLANGIEITVADDDLDNGDVSGLSQLAFNGTNQNLTEVVEASDAEFSFNGIGITRSSNTVDDLLQGVTLELNGTNPGSAATITIAEDQELVADRVADFVEKFNALRTIINDLTEFNPTNPDVSGLLLGDSTVRTVNSQIRSLIAGVVEGLEGSPVRSLVDVGIKTNRDTGLLEFNRNTFISTMKENPDDVVALFAEQGRTSDDQVEFDSHGINTAPGSYDLNITQMATQGSFTGNVDLSAGVTINAGNDSFKIEVDGVESNDITLAANTYSQEDLLTEIQARIDADTNLTDAGLSVIVSMDEANQLTFTSTSYGSASAVNFTSVDTGILTDLGIDAIAGTAGLDVEGTINGQTAAGVGQQLSLSGDDAAAGLVVNITGGTTGERGKVTVIEGVGERFVDLLSNYISFEGLLTTRTNGFNEQLLQIDEQRASLDLRVESLRSRLVQQFTAADIIISKLNSTSDFISRQLAALDGSAKNN